MIIETVIPPEIFMTLVQILVLDEQTDGPKASDFYIYDSVCYL